MRAYLQKSRTTTIKLGRQSVKSLQKQGASLENIEISSDNIGTFKRTARKHNLSFALKRNNAETPPRWIVFFKAKDSKALEAAFSEYSRSVLKQKNRNPSMLAELAKFKELTKTAADPVKNRDRGGLEL